MEEKGQQAQEQQQQQIKALAELIPIPDREQVAQGLAKIVAKLHELRDGEQLSDRVPDDTYHIRLGRVIGMIDCLSIIYNVSYSDAKRILYDD